MCCPPSPSGDIHGPASGTNCVSIDGPRTDGHSITFTAILDQNTRANLLNVQGAYGFSWLLDGRPQETTNSALTIQVPGGGIHQIKVQFWGAARQGGGAPAGHAAGNVRDIETISD